VTQKLTALELAITQFENDEAAQADPDLLPIIKQLQQRLTTGNDCVQNMIKETRSFAAGNQASEQALPPLPAGLLSRQSYSPRLLWQNLRLDSPPFRFALRVSTAVLIGLLIGVAVPELGEHAYWIVLTIIIIMKPAFAQTKQRNYQRLSGTLIGCLIAFVLCSLTTNHMLLGMVIGVSLLLIPAFMFINYQIAVILITLLVLLSLQLLLPHSINLIAERGLDTVIGSIIALACSRILPWWEAKSLPDLARTLAERTADLLTAALDQMRADTGNAPTPTWSLAKRDALVAYSNFANALYRMMREPKAQQIQAQAYNDLLVSCHVLATEISTIVFLSQRSKYPMPQETVDILQAMSAALRTQAFNETARWHKDPWWSEAPSVYEHPLRQLHLAFERTLNDLSELNVRSRNH
ncbi:MAG TPA: FUSC family protein, partial [Orrella sp.]